MPPSPRCVCLFCGESFTNVRPWVKRRYCSLTCSSRDAARRRVVPLNARLEKWVQQAASTDCWLWTGPIGSNGYGRLRLGKKTIPAHRLAYTVWVGEIPLGMFVCHRCDTPLCCNPAHLFVGTCQDNVRDAYAKGRMHNNPKYGEDNWRHKLTAAIVKKIRTEWHQQSTRSLAKQLGVVETTVRNIRKGRTWKNVV